MSYFLSISSPTGKSLTVRTTHDTKQSLPELALAVPLAAETDLQHGNFKQYPRDWKLIDKPRFLPSRHISPGAAIGLISIPLPIYFVVIGVPLDKYITGNLTDDPGAGLLLAAFLLTCITSVLVTLICEIVIYRRRRAAEIAATPPPPRELLSYKARAHAGARRAKQRFCYAAHVADNQHLQVLQFERRNNTLWSRVVHDEVADSDLSVAVERAIELALAASTAEENAWQKQQESEREQELIDAQAHELREDARNEAEARTQILQKATRFSV